ncbi:MAG TPA: hypothetical protein VF767_10580, partial [Bryobacteraceae bacterium]
MKPPIIAVFLGACLTVSSGAAPLPARYFQLMEAGAKKVESRLNAEPEADLAALERQSEWKHFGYSILAPAVLFAKAHPANPRYRDTGMLALALKIGDLLASEDEKGKFEPRLDSDWDAYTWLEAYRLLEKNLGEQRRARWATALKKNVGIHESDARDRLDFPWYNSPYIGTSPNHYALWAANLLLGGQVFGNGEWEQLGRRILERFAAVEQTPDGYWGEHSRSGPTTGYNHLTLSAVALYWELTRDPKALQALRRATDFHEHFTYPDGMPVEVINDRNRHWSVSAWGQFAFSNFPDGRGYAEFLTGFFQPETLTMDLLGRISQDALYYHEGETQAAPQQLATYAHRMSVPAGIRKTGPWVVCLSGIIDTQTENNQFYLDRQGNLSIFHEKLGMIVTGANSKRQPELATFSEALLGRVFHLPLSSRLEMNGAEDRLSLAYNTFWTDLFVPRPEQNEMRFRFVIAGKGSPAEDPKLTLQVCLKPGESVETGGGRRFTAGAG